MQNWRDISYLKSGNSRQKAAFVAIQNLKILSLLSSYDPILVSTICLGIDIPESDIDIIFYAKDLNEFSNSVNTHFGKSLNYTSRQILKDSKKCIVTTFESGGFQFEFFAADTPTEDQSAFKHLIQTARILNIGGDTLREEIKKLKIAGHKTEPAIAKLLGLFGDPYQAVIRLDEVPDEDLEGLCTLAVRRSRAVSF